MDSDLALLKLKENLTVDHAIPTFLPNENAPIIQSLSVDLTGWGYTENSTDTVYEMIQFVQVSPKTLTQCRENYIGKMVTENMWCAGHEKRGITSCNGDFGGPAILSGKLYGIQSWGEGCGDIKHPSVFVMVSNFIHWINETIHT